MGPGSIIAPSTTGPSSHPSSTQSTGSPTISSVIASSAGGSSNTGAIVGGVVGGIAAICIAVAAVLYRRRRSRAQPAVLDNPSGSPTTMRLYVRISVSPIALVCLMHHFLSHFRSCRTQMIQLRSRDTNPMLVDITATPLSDFAPRSHPERIALLPHVFFPLKPLFPFQFGHGCEWRSFL